MYSKKPKGGNAFRFNLGGIYKNKRIGIIEQTTKASLHRSLVSVLYEDWLCLPYNPESGVISS